MSAELFGGSLIPGAEHFGNPGFGILGANIPSSGTDGPSAFYGALNLPADNAVEIMGQVSRFPGGTFFIQENGAFDYVGPPDYFEFLLKQDGVPSAVDIGYGPGISRILLNTDPGGSFSGALTLASLGTSGIFGNLGPSSADGSLGLDGLTCVGAFISQVPIEANGNLGLDGLTCAGLFFSVGNLPDPLCAARVVKVPADAQLGYLREPPRFQKDPTAVHDYGFDFTDALAQIQPDEVLSYTIFGNALLDILSVGQADVAVYGALVGGGHEASAAELTCRLTMVSGRVLESSLVIVLLNT